MLPDGNNGYIRYQLNSIEDLYKYKDELIASASRYLAVKSEPSKLAINDGLYNDDVIVVDTNGDEEVEVEIIEPENRRPWWRRR